MIFPWWESVVHGTHVLLNFNKTEAYGVYTKRVYLCKCVYPYRFLSFFFWCERVHEGQQFLGPVFEEWTLCVGTSALAAIQRITRRRSGKKHGNSFSADWLRFKSPGPADDDTRGDDECRIGSPWIWQQNKSITNACISGFRPLCGN